MQQATFEIRSAFGQVRAYPTNEAAQDLCSLTGAKTLLPQAISTMTRLGFACVDQHGKEIEPAQLY